jgi:hypothetical protein
LGRGEAQRQSSNPPTSHPPERGVPVFLPPVRPFLIKQLLNQSTYSSSLFLAFASPLG